MTPKEKAEHLVKGFTPIFLPMRDDTEEFAAFVYGRQCAQLAVNEIINTHHSPEWWNEVKEEIDKIKFVESK